MSVFKKYNTRKDFQCAHNTNTAVCALKEMKISYGQRVIGLES